MPRRRNRTHVSIPQTILCAIWTASSPVAPQPLCYVAKPLSAAAHTPACLAYILPKPPAFPPQPLWCLCSILCRSLRFSARWPLRDSHGNPAGVTPMTASLRRFSSSTDKRRILELAAGRRWNRTRENTEKMSAPINKSPSPAGAQISSLRSSNVSGHLRYAFLALLLPFCQSYAATDDSCGGWLELKGTKTGFFHTEQIQSRWWLVSPEGNAL